MELNLTVYCLPIISPPGVGAGGDLGTITRRHHLPHGDRKAKVVRLSELISVLRLPPNAEENMSAFCVETHERTMVFAALKDECVEWVEKLCQSTFQVRGKKTFHNLWTRDSNQQQHSRVSASQFWVAVQKTEAATRCGLQGSYWLQVGLEALQLKESQQKDVVREWPYELFTRMKQKSGRRCDSGPGTFIFETQQVEKIFTLIQSTIKRKTQPASQEGEKAVIINQAYSPLPKIPTVASVNSILEIKAKTQGTKYSSLEDIQGDFICQSESGSAHPAPITLMPLPSVPTHNSSFGSPCSDPSDVVYATPAKCIQSAPKLEQTRAVYVDPASVLPLKPPGSRDAVTPSPNSAAPHPCFSIDHTDSGYSEVYDKISPVQNKQAVLSKAKAKCFGKDEPIYSEPLNKKEEMSHRNETKSDPFAHLYAQVCKTPPTSSPVTTTTTTTTKDTGQSLDDVIYESLGVI
uniref:IRS-type PTB domain-containing protein n=1 Tax=Anabas testudineus TaxID=64144 RepID=A0A7N6AF84_ANATE